jgi:hypothetical protein
MLPQTLKITEREDWNFPTTFDCETQPLRRRTNRMDVLKALLSPDMYTLIDASILSMAQVVVQILTAYKSQLEPVPSITTQVGIMY